MPQVGDVVAGKYAIVRVLGEGGMGVVYEAMHQRLRQRVALKMLLPSMFEHEVIISRFDREARAAAQLRGRHVARVNDVDVTGDGLPYMVMDFLEGHDLEVEIGRRGKLPVPEAVDYVLQACAAMVEAHQLGIVHRDLKPSNLFLEQDASAADDHTRIVKVLDFGISKLQADADAKLTDADTMMGTALYMSPEQVRASHAVDARSDIWALGVILYEAFTGHPPWFGSPHQVAAAIVTEDAPDVRTLCPDVSRDLAAIIQKTLQREPNNRFPDVRQLAMALAPFAPHGSVGRSFAENVIAMGSHPRVSITPMSESQRSLLPSDSDSARTVINAPGVSEELMRPREGTLPSPGSSRERAGTSSGRRAALLGVGVAFIVSLVSIGGVAVFVQRRDTPANGAKPETSVASSVHGATTAVPQPSEPVSGELGPASPQRSSDPPMVASSPTPPAAASTKLPSPSPAPSPRPTQASPPATARSSTPTPIPKPTTAPDKGDKADKPLFL